MLLSISVNTLWAKPVDTIETYGVYVVAEKGFVKIGSYIKTERFVDFKYINEIPYVKRGDQNLKLVVFEKNFHADNMVFELRPIDTNIELRPIKFDVKPMSKPDMYELTTEKPVPDGTMLQVNGSFYSNSFGAIMLGEPQAQLVKYFSQKQLPDAPIVLQYLEDARAAFPGNAALKELDAYWQKAAKSAKDKKGYTYVEEKWNQYQQAEKLKLKERYLNDLIGEINGYLNDHPDGYKAAEAKERKKHAEDKLKEYAKLL
jgi:hypothetical protein